MQAGGDDGAQGSVLVLNSGTVPTSALPQIIEADVRLALEATADAGTMQFSGHAKVRAP